MIVWKRKWNFLKITLLVASASFAVNILLINHNPTAAFYFSMSRFWELMVGGMLAYIALDRPSLISKYKNSQSVLGFLLITVGLIVLNKSKDFPGWWAILPTMGAFFVISAGPNAWLNQKLLANKVMVWIGLISYPLYLWHWSLLSFAEIVESGQASRKVKFVALVLSVVMAWATYRYVEKPVRFGKRRRLATILLLGVMIIAFTLGLLINQQKIVPRINGPEIQSMIAAVQDWDYPNGFMRKPDSPGGLFYLQGAKSATTLFFGDSHMEQYGPKAVDSINRNKGKTNSLIFLTGGGCPPIPDVFEDAGIHTGCNSFIKNGLNIINDPDVKIVVIGACWNCYFDYEARPKAGRDGFNYYSVENGKKYYFRDGVGVDVSLKKLEAFIRMLAKKKRVVLVLDNPMGEQYDPKFYFAGNRFSALSLKNDRQRIPITPEHKAIRERLIDIAKRQQIEYVDPAAMICTNDICNAFTDNGIPIYKDNSHLRPFFVRNNASFLDRFILDD